MSLPGDGEGRASGGGTSANTKGTQVSIARVWEGQQSWTEAIHYVRRAQGIPRRTDGCLPPQLLRAALFSSQGPHHSEDSNAGSPQEPHRSSWKLSVVAKLPVASFLWVPWAALLARETAHHTYFKHQCNGLWPIEG